MCVSLAIISICTQESFSQFFGTEMYNGFFPISKRNQSWWVLSSPARKWMRGVGPLGTRLKKVADAVSLRTSFTNLSVHVDTPTFTNKKHMQKLSVNLFFTLM